MIDAKIIEGKHAAEFVDPFYAFHGFGALARVDDVFFTAFDGPNLIGAVRFCVEEETPMLRSMMIHKARRQKGVGLHLLKIFDKYLNTHSIHGTHCLPYGHLVKFYGLIGFEMIEESKAPPFLIERLAGYRAKNPTTDYICMRRP